MKGADVKLKMKMKKLVLLIVPALMCGIMFTGCEKDNRPMESIIGKWQLVKGYDLMMGGVYPIDTENQRIEEYTKGNLRILYDYLGKETARCNYRATESVITIYGEEITGTKWEHNYNYWFSKDTLKIHHDGGFEFYDEFFVRIK